MVRLVFRPYARVGRSICTSESLRASTGVSPGFALPERSSPSFGSRRRRSFSAPPSARRGAGRQCARTGRTLVRLRRGILPGRADVVLAFTPPGGFETPRDSRRRQTPWSVFQDGSGGQPSALRRRPAAGGTRTPPRPRSPRGETETARRPEAPRPAAPSSTRGRARVGDAARRPLRERADASTAPPGGATASRSRRGPPRGAPRPRREDASPADPRGPFASVPPVYP